MMKKDSVSIAVMANATALPLAAGVVLQWDGQSGECQEVGPNSLPVQGQHAPFQVPGPLTAHHAGPYWTTREISRVPVLSLSLRAWEQEATRLTFSLARGWWPPAPRCSGDLVWVHWRWQSSASRTGQRPEA